VSALVRSELLKLHSTRTSPLLLAWMTGLILLIVLLHVFSLSLEHLTGSDGQLKIVGWGTSIGVLFASLLGASSITAEIRYGTIRPTLLATPNRTRVIAAKLAASAIVGIGVGLLAEALTAGIEAAGLAARGIPIALGVADYAQLIAGGALAAGLFAAIGVGLGALVRSQVGALIALCVWVLLIETTLIGNVPAAGKFAPAAAAGALAGAIQTQSASKLLAPAIAALLLLVYTALASAAGIIATAHRDIN
jgi:hypothetical protein